MLSTQQQAEVAASLARREASRRTFLLQSAGVGVGCFAGGIGAAEAQIQAPTKSPPEPPRRQPTIEFPEKETTLVVRHKDYEEPVVARLLCRGGATAFVHLPGGEIHYDDADEMTPTSKPFKPLSFEELGKHLVNLHFKGFKVASSKRYLYVYKCSDKFRLGTSKILESMYNPLEQYFKREKIPTVEAEFPLVVVIFDTYQSMREYKEVDPSVVAFYEPISNRVVLSEYSRLVQLNPDFGIPQAFGTIAHEGVHQILHNIGVQQRLSDWPAWISEGMAEYFAPLEVSNSGTWKGVGKRNDLRMLELTRLPAPQAGRITLTEQTVVAPNLTSTGYATAWALTHYLAEKRRKQLVEYLRDVAQMKPLEKGEPEKEIVRFKKYFGDDLFKIETGLHQHVLTLLKTSR